jgi:hypothetical protein
MPPEIRTRFFQLFEFWVSANKFVSQFLSETLSVRLLSVFRLPPCQSIEYLVVGSIGQIATRWADCKVYPFPGPSGPCISDICPLCLCPHARFRFGFARPDLLLLSDPSNLPTFQPSNLPTFQPSNLPTFQPSNLPNLRHGLRAITIPSREACGPNSAFSRIRSW